MASSAHLDEIIDRKESATNLMVVFADIVKYSRRRTVAQKIVVDAFTECLRAAMDETAAESLPYLQRNNKNFLTDVIRLPTGDGAAVGFSFEGLHEVHVTFARNLLRRIDTLNTSNDCEVFARDGWCNCHSSQMIRVGIAEGKTVIYRDLNGNYNAAGTAINIAARVMGLAEGGQVMLSSGAYEHLVDMADDPRLNEHFTDRGEVPVKHGLMLQVYQYTDERLQYLNRSMPGAIKKAAAMTAMGNMPGMPNLKAINTLTDEETVQVLSVIA